MRAWWLVFLLMGGAQAAVVLEDPAGDLQLRPVGSAPVDAQWVPTDLLALEIIEWPTEMDFIITHRPQGGADLRTMADGVTWQVRFNVGSVAYMIEAYDSPFYGTRASVIADLYKATTPEQELGELSTRVTRLPATFDVGAGRITVTVLRADLRDELDVEAGGKRDLLNLYAEAWGGYDPAIFGEGTWPAMYDRMPDEGLATFDLQHGHAQGGHIQLATAERLRASNGVATTYFFDMNVRNTAEFEDNLALSLGAVPNAWQVRLPYESMVIPANSTVRFPLLLTVPFNHQHGVIDTFLVEARSDRDPDVAGIIELGVEYLAVAQPAGHHPLAYLHGSGADPAPLQGGGLIQWGAARLPGWFNTLEEDPRDPGERLLGVTARGGNLAEPRYGWIVPLDPTLRLGLDFDLDREGRIALNVGTSLPLSDSVFYGFVALIDRGNVTGSAVMYDDFSGVFVVADVTPQAVGDMGAEESRSVETTIVARPEADIVPPGRDQNMVLILWLEGQGSPPLLGYEDRAWIEPGASLELPLFEYHDPIDEAFAAPDFIHIGIAGAQERFVAPGGTVLYDLLLRNDGIRDGTFDLQVYGTHADWVSFPAGSRFVAPSAGEVIIPIALSPGAEAEPGDEVDVVIEAVAREDERMRGLIRIKAVVDEARAVEQDVDDTQQVEEIVAATKKSPMPLSVVLAALALGLVRRRQGAKDQQ